MTKFIYYCAMMVALLGVIPKSFAFTENPILSEAVAFTGVVKFEQRFTRVQPTQCDSGPCLKSKPYWSVVFDSGQAKYLIDKRIEGENVPETIKLNGVTLRPGSRVRVIGDVVSSGPAFFLVLNIQKIKLLKELGWSCRSSDESGPKLHAHVWHDLIDETDGTYKIRIQEVKGQSIFQIAYLDHALTSSQEGQVLFGGKNSQETVELRIFQEPDQTLDYQSFLRVVKKHEVNQGVMPLEMRVEMVCNRTRFSDN